VLKKKKCTNRTGHFVQNNKIENFCPQISFKVIAAMKIVDVWPCLSALSREGGALKLLLWSPQLLAAEANSI